MNQQARYPMTGHAVLKAPRMWVVPSMSGQTGSSPGSVEECTAFSEELAKRVKERALRAQHRERSI